MSKFSDYFEAQKKSKIKAGDGLSLGKYKFFNSSNIQTKFYDEAQYNNEALIFGTGGNASIHYCNEPFSTSTDCIVFFAKRNDFSVKLVYQYLSGNIYILQNGFKGAGIKHISKEYIEDIELNLPALEKQYKIVETLDKVTHTIDICNQIIEKLDLLIKSRFSEMFSDIDKILNISDICSIITDGTHQPPEFTQNGIPFLFVSNIVTNEITYNTEKFILEETYNELYKRTPIEIGDIVLSTVGSYGHPAVVKSDKKFLFQRHIAYLKPIKNIVNSVYLHSAILSEKTQNQIECRVKGIAQKTLNLSELRKISVPVPPLEIQQKFAYFVEQVEKSKNKVKQVLERAETLKKSLIQEYF